MPITPKVKGNLTARYTWDIRGMEAHVQGAYLYEGERKSDLRLYERALIGDLPPTAPSTSPSASRRTSGRSTCS
jgi:hypothetical protein